MPAGHLGGYFSKVLTMGLVGKVGANRWALFKIFTKDPLSIGQANCFRTHNELTMGLLGKYPLAPSERNVELTVATTLRLNLDWIASQTMTRLRQVSILFPAGPWQGRILQHAAESTFMLTPDNIRGRLMETPHGPGLVSDFALELMILLLDENGTRFLLMLVGDWMESPQWEEGSHEEEGF